MTEMCIYTQANHSLRPIHQIHPSNPSIIIQPSIPTLTNIHPIRPIIMHKRAQKSSASKSSLALSQRTRKNKSKSTISTITRRSHATNCAKNPTHKQSHRQFSTTAPLEQYKGSIDLIMGPMFSGKTTELLKSYRASLAAGHKAILIKHSSDTRYHGQTQVVSHTDSREPAVSAHLLADENLIPLMADRTHVFIDEGQFFPDLHIMADKFANNGQTVVVAALDGTFQREPFPVIANLIPKVENLTKLKSSCHTCGDDAPFSRRISADQEVHVVGGADKYQASCRKHFFHIDAV